MPSGEIAGHRLVDPITRSTDDQTRCASHLERRTDREGSNASCIGHPTAENTIHPSEAGRRTVGGDGPRAEGGEEGGRAHRDDGGRDDQRADPAGSAASGSGGAAPARIHPAPARQSPTPRRRSSRVSLIVDLPSSRAARSERGAAAHARRSATGAAPAPPRRCRDRASRSGRSVSRWLAGSIAIARRTSSRSSTSGP